MLPSINVVDDLSHILQNEVGVFKMHRIKCTVVIKTVLVIWSFGEGGV